MSTDIWSREYQRMLMEICERQLLAEPTQEDIERALFDQIEQWTPEARRWMGIDDKANR